MIQKFITAAEDLVHSTLYLRYVVCIFLSEILTTISTFMFVEIGCSLPKHYKIKKLAVVYWRKIC